MQTVNRIIKKKKGKTQSSGLGTLPSKILHPKVKFHRSENEASLSTLLEAKNISRCFFTNYKKQSQPPPPPHSQWKKKLNQQVYRYKKKKRKKRYKQQKKINWMTS